MDVNEDVQAIVIMAIWYAIVCVGIAGVFRKAQRPLWKAFVPMENASELCRVAGVSGWWVAATFVPILNFVAALYVALQLAQRFGYSEVVGILLVFSGFTLLPIIGFGRALYQRTTPISLPSPDSGHLSAGAPEFRSVTWSSGSAHRESRLRMTVLSCVYGLALLCVPGLLIVGTMAFGGITSSQKSAAELCLVALALTPVSLLIALVGGWLFHRRHQYRAAIALAILPVLNLIGFIAGFLLVVGC